MDFKTMTIEDIIAWCQENNQVAWLKAEAAKKVQVKVYPRIKVEQVVKDKDGNETTKFVSSVDKTKPYSLEERPITFVQLKKAFCEQFMPQLIKGKAAKKTMFDKIAEL